MIKNCFITDSDFFEYNIKFKDEIIATAHTLSIRDKQKIFKFNAETETPDTDQTLLIKCALDSWQFADKAGKVLPITVDNVANLKQEYFNALAIGIMQHEIDVNTEAKEIEKN